MIMLGEAGTKIGRGVVYSKLSQRNALCCSARRAPSSSGAAAGFARNLKSPKTKQSAGNARKCRARSRFTTISSAGQHSAGEDVCVGSVRSGPAEPGRCARSRASPSRSGEEQAGPAARPLPKGVTATEHPGNPRKAPFGASLTVNGTRNVALMSKSEAKM